MEPEIGLDKSEKEIEDEFRTANLESVREPNESPGSPEARQESKIRQPEVPGAKPAADNKAILHTTKLHKHNHMHGEGCGQQLTESESSKMTVKEWTSLQEIEGFNYSDYLIRILRRLRIDKFEDLAAITDQQLVDGLLSKRDINKLRIILKDGFRKNRTLGEIQIEIETSIALKDRLKDGKITMASSSRPNAITRTETVRIANLGLIDTYKDNNIKQLRFLASLSERTCPQCEALNGQVFLINEAEGLIPVHTMCRCTWLSVA